MKETSAIVLRISTQADVLRFMFHYGGPRCLVGLLVLGLAWHGFIGWNALEVIVLLSIFGLRGIHEWVVHKYVTHADPLPLIGLRLENVVSGAHMTHHRGEEGLDDMCYSAASIFFLFGAPFGVLLIFPSLLWLSLDISIYLMAYFLLYEYCHTLAHSQVVIRWGWLARTVAIHKRHHLRGYGNTNFGVTSGLGDRLFGTLVK